MSEINILSEDLINKIAAGEVVERPASVVKELIENALDADATSIIVEIKNSGQDLIRITDNGKGMNEVDARKSVLRHATSKLKTVEDLFSIGTLGFRGEALASIAAISQFSLITKQKDQLEGFNLVLEFNGFLQSDKKEDGAKAVSSDVNSLIVSPGIGWSNKKIQTLLAYQRTLVGTNTDANDSVVFTLVYPF